MEVVYGLSLRSEAFLFSGQADHVKSRQLRARNELLEGIEGYNAAPSISRFSLGPPSQSARRQTHSYRVFRLCAEPRAGLEHPLCAGLGSGGRSPGLPISPQA